MVARNTAQTIISGINKKKVTAVVLLDMSKAFDTINLEILLNKLQEIGISPFGITLFNSY